jgi:leader peptidase (prepilin peptidase)/N-methyltransferase
MTSPALAERIATWPWAEGATVLFGFAWGAMLGSFINVVVHRLPRGESVVTNRSRCPRCGAAIRSSDNVPVLGWLRLGGRCRDCNAAIAAIYPVVEAGCGGAVMLLAAAELAGGGRWLPAFAGEHPAGIDRLLRGDWQLLAAFFLHAAVVLTVLTWSLLDAAGHHLTRTIPAATLALAVMAVALLPSAAPPVIWPGTTAWPTTERLLAAVSGAGTGIVAVWLARWSAGSRPTGQGVCWGLPLLGCVLGWQAVLVVAFAAAVAARTACQGGWALGAWLAAAGTMGLAFLGPLERCWTAFVGGGGAP